MSLKIPSNYDVIEIPTAAAVIFSVFFSSQFYGYLMKCIFNTINEWIIKILQK